VVNENRLDPRVRTVWALGGALVALLVGVGGVALTLVLGAPGWVTGLVVSATLLLLAGSVVGATLSYGAWRYIVGREGLELSHGVIVRHVSLIPYHRIQQIDVRRGVIERSLGLSTLVLRTAAATSDATIPGLSEATAAPLRMELLGHAGVSDAV
jgi:membrane protein YdbS with pleckstrin-like domain